MSEDRKRPEWVPENGGNEFTTSVMKGVEDAHHRSRRVKPSGRRRNLTIEEYVEGVVADDRTTLARAITLIESNRHIDQAQELLRQLPSGNSIRIGITGVPGAGKSTFIEAFGIKLIEQGHKVAVLAVDPSSSISRGSVLGDKTRMELLSREPNSFIRPSPSGGELGGVTRKTRETAIVCEAAGFDVILIETVGVGQNEITVRSMVDFFLLMKIAGAGDELQGIKKGVMELADVIVINKADGDNLTAANRARAEIEQVLHYINPATKGWHTPAVTCSALDGSGIAEMWDIICKFRDTTTQSGIFDARRRQQSKDWMHAMIKEALLNKFYNNPEIKSALPDIEQKIVKGDLPVTQAVRELLKLLDS